MTVHEICSNREPHLHSCPLVTIVFAGHVLAFDGRLVGLFPTADTVIAERVAVLLARHGLVDVPTTLEENPL